MSLQYQDSDRGSEGNQRVRLVEAWRAQASCVLCQGVYSVYCIFPSQLCSGTSGALTYQPTSRAVSGRQQRRHNKPVMCDMHGMVASSLPRTGETPSSVSGHRMTAQLQLSSDFAVNCSEYAFWRCMAEVNHDPTPVYGDGEEEKYNFHNQSQQ